jgi:hypothetical protein
MNRLTEVSAAQERKEKAEAKKAQAEVNNGIRMRLYLPFTPPESWLRTGLHWAIIQTDGEHTAIKVPEGEPNTWRCARRGGGRMPAYWLDEDGGVHPDMELYQADGAPGEVTIAMALEMLESCPSFKIPRHLLQAREKETACPPPTLISTIASGSPGSYGAAVPLAGVVDGYEFPVGMSDGKKMEAMGMWAMAMEKSPISPDPDFKQCVYLCSPQFEQEKRDKAVRRQEKAVVSLCSFLF